MPLHFHVENLGKIKSGNFTISPLTVITGPNGTGKSFFTKTIYSIFKVMEQATTLKSMKIIANDFLGFLHALETSYNENKELREKVSLFKDGMTIPYETLVSIFEQVNSLLQDTSQDDKEIRKQIGTLLEKHFQDSLELSIHAYPDKEPDDLTPEESAKVLVSHLLLQIMIIRMFSHGADSAAIDSSAIRYILTHDLEEELIHNFQIESIDELLSTSKSTITLNDYFKLDLMNDRISAEVDDTCTKSFVQRPSAVFFESPAYWRVRDALIDAKLASSNYEFLTGVPKYFFDLNSDLSKKSIKNSNFPQISKHLESALGGEFVFERGKFYFNDNHLNKKISKNLVSFGMTNLGILNALIKNNVIQKDSFVFIDEPETNLHPDWQVLMIESLATLSQSGVNIVINTHSTEILKYIEIAFSKIRDEQGDEAVQELLAVNYLDTDGTTLEFDSECPVEQAKEALSHLSSPFFDLYMQGQ
ncbi:AAA family ATPase [Vibrio plantisponsor]|uniref:AAA family ATPase n=1 Tax=Vibrio plantisponsor TaxID=664643 RepID=A0ABU4IMV9_9VIBR|nr:AAA family ATPase [Vibrio plantisponsor]MDW6019912.1 AAA family ATPase [Vibrio plantisponsor]NNM38759.1 AAA family ATPase [Vibrio plantisponsor]